MKEGNGEGEGEGEIGCEVAATEQRKMVDAYVKCCERKRARPNQGFLSSLSTHIRTLPSLSSPLSLSLSSPSELTESDLIAAVDTLNVIQWMDICVSDGEEKQRSEEKKGEGEKGWNGEEREELRKELYFDMSRIRFASLSPVFSLASSSSVLLTSLVLSHANASDEACTLSLSLSHTHTRTHAHIHYRIM